MHHLHQLLNSTRPRLVKYSAMGKVKRTARVPTEAAGVGASAEQCVVGLGIVAKAAKATRTKRAFPTAAAAKVETNAVAVTPTLLANVKLRPVATTRGPQQVVPIVKVDQNAME